MALYASSVTRPVIDLNGPAGNVYSLINMVEQYGQQLGWTKARIDEVRTEMRSSDYVHAVQVFEKHFGAHIDIIVPEDLEEALL